MISIVYSKPKLFSSGEKKNLAKLFISVWLGFQGVDLVSWREKSLGGRKR